jgi:hypothetical protein
VESIGMPIRRLLLALALGWAGLALVLSGERLRGAVLQDLGSSAGAERHGPGKDIVASQQVATAKVPPAPSIKRVPRHQSTRVAFATPVRLFGRESGRTPSIDGCSVCVRIRRHIPRLNADDPPWNAGV